MSEVGLVDDAAFAANWVASRQARRSLSSSALRRELAGKGVAREIVDQALAQVSTDDEHVAALALAQRKLRAMTSLAPQVQRRRLAGVLARRGFSSAITGRVLAEVVSEASAPSGGEDDARAEA